MCEPSGSGWNQAERELLQFIIAARKPWVDVGLCSMNPDGSEQKFEASAAPIFGEGCRFTRFRGVGVERRASLSHSYGSTVDRSDASLLFTVNRTMCDCAQIESFLQCMMRAGTRSLPGRVLAVLGSVTS